MSGNAAKSKRLLAAFPDIVKELHKHHGLINEQGTKDKVPEGSLKEYLQLFEVAIKKVGEHRLKIEGAGAVDANDLLIIQGELAAIK
eukprot:6135954-Alexandrium_andersonii.AAC.1